MRQDGFLRGVRETWGGVKDKNSHVLVDNTRNNLLGLVFILGIQIQCLVVFFVRFLFPHLRFFFTFWFLFKTFLF
jgi:hypothetical protein